MGRPMLQKVREFHKARVTREQTRAKGMKPKPVLHLWGYVLLALTFLSSPVAAQTTHTINISKNSFSDDPHSFAFSPKNFTVEVGDTVKWVNPYRINPSSASHNVTADDYSFASPTSFTFVYSHTFTREGEFLYHCSLHSSPGQNRNQFENGRILVKGGDGGNASNLALQYVHAASGNYSPGDLLPIDLTVENAGGSAAPAFSITYYASTDAIIDSSDLALGTDNLPGLNAGQTSNVTGYATFPVNIPGNIYFVGAIINVSDANNDNNIGISSEQVEVEFQINAGVNDAWFASYTPGQGFFITVFPGTQEMFLAWFTYDVERPQESVTALLGDPGHRWLTAFGSYSGALATLDVELTQGGVFDSPTPVPTQSADGTITVWFTSCKEAFIHYDLPSIAKSGDDTIVRLALDNVPFCESLSLQ